MSGLVSGVRWSFRFETLSIPVALPDLQYAPEVVLEVMDKDTISGDDFLAEYRHSLASPKTILSKAAEVRATAAATHPLTSGSVQRRVYYRGGSGRHMKVVVLVGDEMVFPVCQLPPVLSDPEWVTLSHPDTDPEHAKMSDWGELLVSFQVLCDD